MNLTPSASHETSSVAGRKADWRGIAFGCVVLALFSWPNKPPNMTLAPVPSMTMIQQDTNCPCPTVCPYHKPRKP